MQILVDSGLKMTDHNIDDEGYEVEISAFKVNLYRYQGQCIDNIRINGH